MVICFIVPITSLYLVRIEFKRSLIILAISSELIVINLGPSGPDN